MEALEKGSNLLIFPEKQSQRTLETVSDFHTGFIYLAKYYWQATGKKLHFYPVHVDSKVRVITIGQAVEYVLGTEFHLERARITAELQKAINGIALKNGGAK